MKLEASVCKNIMLCPENARIERSERNCKRNLKWPSLHVKMIMHDSQLYPLKLWPIKVELTINVCKKNKKKFNCGFSTKLTCAFLLQESISRIRNNLGFTYLNLEKLQKLLHYRGFKNTVSRTGKLNFKQLSMHWYWCS